jgi:hypothetical protein
MLVWMSVVDQPVSHVSSSVFYIVNNCLALQQLFEPVSQKCTQGNLINQFVFPVGTFFFFVTTNTMVSPKTQPKIMHHHSSSSYAHHQRNNDQQQNQPQRKEEEGREERKLSRRLEGTRFEVITRNDPPATFKNFPTAESDYPSMADVFNVDSRQHLTFTGNDNSKRHFTETLRRLSLLPMQLPLAVRNYSSGITGIPGITHRRRKTETTTQRSCMFLFSP